MMVLIVIYIVFISLGLPDSLLGATWPVVHNELNISESFASVYSIIVGASTGISSFIAGKVIRKFGTAKITLFSISLTVLGLFGISFSNNFVVMGIFYIILGLGAGAIDTGLNNYVSLNYKASHMNWLHCFWGIGVTASPVIMSFFLNSDIGSWRNGYRIIALIQLAIAFLVGFVLRKWQNAEKQMVSVYTHNDLENVGIKKIIKMRGVVLSIISLGIYCGMEFLVGTWGATYIVNALSLSPNIAAKWVSLYYLGIMFGRLISGFISIKFSDKALIRIGLIIAFIGIIMLILKERNTSLIAMLIIGFGYGPIFPSILHSIPQKFGEKYSVDITGYHMGLAGVLGYLSQLIFGYIASATTFKIMPIVILLLCVCLFIVHEFTLIKLRKRNI